jgi:hypothetical protein
MWADCLQQLDTSAYFVMLYQNLIKFSLLPELLLIKNEK